MSQTQVQFSDTLLEAAEQPVDHIPRDQQRVWRAPVTLVSGGNFGRGLGRSIWRGVKRKIRQIFAMRILQVKE